MWSPLSPSSARGSDCPPGERGRASLEFLVIAIAVFIPLLLFTLTLWSLQRAQFATEAAARHAVRVYSLQTNAGQAGVLSDRAIAHALAQHGVHDAYRATLRCQGGCLNPGSWVEISVRVDVPVGQIPLIPARLPLSIPIESRASAQISGYRGEP